MARVYRAVLDGKMGFQKVVALKRIHRVEGQNYKSERALINEARLGGRLRHPHIVETYELDEIGGDWLLALEYVDGWSLQQILRFCRTSKQWLPPSVAVEILEAVLRALAYAHGLAETDGRPVGLVHRDLKPDNLMIGRDGSIKVMDFGIAKAATNLFQTTQAGGVKGTLVYMSPEQMAGRTLDRRSDLFSLGGILHELVTLQVPFQGESLPELVAALTATDLAAPRERMGRRCPPLVELMARLLARDPADRYQDADEVLADLDNLRGALPPGPTLSGWLATVHEGLPAPRQDGDFGEQGPPPEQLAEPLRAPAPRANPEGGSVPPPPPRQERMVLFAGVAAALLIGVLGTALLVPRLTSTTVSGSTSGQRDDLITIDAKTLERLVGAQVLRQANQYVTDGRALELTVAEGTVTAEFPNGTRTVLEPDTTLQHTECNCDAEGVCLHRVIAVLAYKDLIQHGGAGNDAGSPGLGRPGG